MKIRTSEELVDRIDSDLVWRRAELTAFYGAAASASRIVQTALLRGSVALLYAHWEGFVKEAAYYYLCFLASKRLKTEQLRAEIAGLSMWSEMVAAAESRNPDLHTKIVRSLRDDSAKRAKIPNDKAAIRTESNLSFRVFAAILSSIGLDSSIHESHRDLIDAELVAVRNRIVHGENETIALPEWVELSAAVLAIMRDVADQIQHAAVEKTYLI
ncbi:MAE_28990/MAE_18760 family HEPN-like nuclease [Microbacterium sp. NPDC089987]|uniref:MAE_28990/MAE_18760 family HEPN-like nuclease n=1 Tax=Microbacterium sp. NPDC089987 TaxID=3364202 RepID=UPI00380D499F